MKTFLFYDVETSGLNPAFDQILTFACIKTDLDLNEIDRQSITIQLRKDIVPSPKAFLTHGLTFDELELGISEYDAARKIHKILNTKDTISIGYNSLGFDDDFLRFMFYRNLLDPYMHQYGNGCYRMDILPIAVIYRVFYPSCIEWPDVKGIPSLKLDKIANVNNFITSGRAHEAMSDVEALIALSKKFFQQKDIWRYCLDFFNKTRDEVRINGIEKDKTIQKRRFRVCIMASISFGAKVNFLAPVIHLGESLAYKNQNLWLRLDSDDIMGLDSGANLEDTFVIRKRHGDALIVLPALERFWDKMLATSQQAAQNNLEKISNHWEIFLKFVQYHSTYKYPFIPNMDADAALYQDGFFSAHEKRQIDLFHKTLDSQKQEGDPQKKEVLSKIKSGRVKILANRILARNFEDKADYAFTTEYYGHLGKIKSLETTDRIIGYKNDIKLNQERGLQELQEAEKELLDPDKNQRKMIASLKNYIEKLLVSSA
jgi:exodeoxyribonuclease-1